MATISSSRVSQKLARQRTKYAEERVRIEAEEDRQIDLATEAAIRAKGKALQARQARKKLEVVIEAKRRTRAEQQRLELLEFQAFLQQRDASSLPSLTSESPCTASAAVAPYRGQTLSDDNYKHKYSSRECKLRAASSRPCYEQRATDADLGRRHKPAPPLNLGQPGAPTARARPHAAPAALRPPRPSDTRPAGDLSKVIKVAFSHGTPEAASTRRTGHSGSPPLIEGRPADKQTDCPLLTPRSAAITGLHQLTTIQLRQDRCRAAPCASRPHSGAAGEMGKTRPDYQTGKQIWVTTCDAPHTGNQLGGASANRGGWRHPADAPQPCDGAAPPRLAGRSRPGDTSRPKPELEAPPPSRQATAEAPVRKETDQKSFDKPFTRWFSQLRKICNYKLSSVQISRRLRDSTTAMQSSAEAVSTLQTAQPGARSRPRSGKEATVATGKAAAPETLAEAMSKLKTTQPGARSRPRPGKEATVATGKAAAPETLAEAMSKLKTPKSGARSRPGPQVEDQEEEEGAAPIADEPAIQPTARSLGSTPPSPAPPCCKREAVKLASPERNPAVIRRATATTAEKTAMSAEEPAILSTARSFQGPAIATARSATSAPMPPLKELKAAAVTTTGLEPAPEAVKRSTLMQKLKSSVHRKPERTEMTAASSRPARATSRRRPPPQRDKGSWSCNLSIHSQLTTESRRRRRHQCRAASRTEKVKAVFVTTARCRVASASREVTQATTRAQQAKQKQRVVMKTDPQRVNNFKVLYSLLETWSATTTSRGSLQFTGSLKQRRQQGTLQLNGDLVEGGDRLLLLHQGRRRAETGPLSAAAA